MNSYWNKRLKGGASLWAIYAACQLKYDFLSSFDCVLGFEILFFTLLSYRGFLCKRKIIKIMVHVQETPLCNNLSLHSLGRRAVPTPEDEIARYYIAIVWLLVQLLLCIWWICPIPVTFITSPCWSLFRERQSNKRTERFYLTYRSYETITIRWWQVPKPSGQTVLVLRLLLFLSCIFHGEVLHGGLGIFQLSSSGSSSLKN